MSQTNKIYSIFKARLHIGYIAVPYVVLGFTLHMALFSFDLNVFIEDQGSFLRFIASILIAFLYMPFIFVINDYYDAEFDKMDEKKRERNPFCNDDFKSSVKVKILTFLPGILTLILGLYISLEAALATILVLFLGVFYSAPPLRFKERPYMDFTVHGVCLGFYFYILGFYSLYITPNPYILPVFWIVMYLSFIDASWIHLDSAMVDYFTDKETNQKTTVVAIGPESSKSILLVIMGSILTLPIIYILTNVHLSNLFGETIIQTLLVIFSIPILSYLIIAYINRKQFEKVRAITSRFRVYIVYGFAIFVILSSNSSIYL